MKHYTRLSRRYVFHHEGHEAHEGKTGLFKYNLRDLCVEYIFYPCRCLSRRTMTLVFGCMLI
jgi:hypothetical protein